MLPSWTIHVLRPTPSLVLTMSVSCLHVCLPECLTHIFNISSKRILSYTICFPSSLSCFRKRHQHPLNSSDQKLGRYLHVLSGPRTPPSSPANACVSTPKKHLGSDCSSAGSHFFFFLVSPQIMWGLSSPTRDGTHVPTVESQSLNH